jgi:succinyl-CoA synthetase alpha subunit
VLALVAGRSAREGVTMGHAGAMVHGDAGSWASKQVALEDAGARVFGTVAALVDAVRAALA